MNDAEELNLKLLERSLEEHESARANFFRDLKFAAVLLLAFQFFIFFRFTNLSDQQFDLRPKLAQAEANHQALLEVRAALEEIETTLKTGTGALAKLLGNLPQEIRNELGQLNEDLVKFRAAPFPPPRPESPVQSPQQFPNAANLNLNVLRPWSPRDSRFLADLEFDELKELRAAETTSLPYRERVIHIVETKIIQQEFQTLNQQVEALVITPLVDGLAGLRQRTETLATLKATGANVEGWLKNAEQVVTVARNLKFSPPAAADWWMSAMSKEDFANSAKLDSARIANEASATLSRPGAELKSLAEKMASAIAILKQQGTRIDAELKQLQEHAVSLEGLIEGYAKPLAVLALEPKDLVIFYPVILAAIVSTFAVRQVLLRRRAATLASAYRDLGASDNILEVCFTELPAPSDNEKKVSRPVWARARRFAGWLWVVPAGFAIASFAWVLASKSLAGEAPRLLYALSALVLVAACLFSLRSSRERLQTV